MIDPHMPLLTEIQALRARLGPKDPADWRDWRCPPSPCLTSILLAQEKEIIGGLSDQLSILDLLDQLAQLSTAPPDPGRVRTAPLLDRWSVRRMDDSCLHLIGDVTGHATITDGTGIFTAPYLRLDRGGEWARTRYGYFRLGLQDRRFGVPS